MERKGLTSDSSVNSVPVTKKNKNKIKIQTDSAELSTGSELSSYYDLNSVQLQCGIPPKVNKIGHLKITLNKGVEA